MEIFREMENVWLRRGAEEMIENDKEKRGKLI